MNKTNEIKLRLRIWFLPLILVLVFVFAILFRYQGWWIIFLAFGLAFSFSTYSIYQLKKDLTIQREMRFGWATVGDILEERIIIKNDGMIPTAWLEIIDQTNIPGHQQAIGTNVGSQSQTQWKSQHVCSRRGLYHLGPTTLETSDLFGFYKLSIHDPSSVSILITPPVVPLPHIQVASGGRTGDGRMVKGVLEQSIAVSTVRDYQPSDPMHHIHWPLSAKHDKLTTFIFENTPTGNWWIVQDMNKAVQVGTQKNNTLEVGIILSASLSNKGIQEGKAVGFIANDNQLSWIRPQHSGSQSMTILQSLARSEVSDISLNTLLKNSRQAFKEPASLIIITPDISLEWWHSLMWLKVKGMIPTVLLLDPASFGGENSAQTLISKLNNVGIQTYLILAEMFSDQLEVHEKPVWEWRVFGTGKAIPIKKPADLEWRKIR